MKRFLCILALACGACAAISGFDDFSKLDSVDPESAKVGDMAAAKGENLGKAKISEIYLTDGKNDIKASISEQSDTEIKFQVPRAQPGRYHLMLLTANRATMMEQPVVLTVE